MGRPAADTKPEQVVAWWPLATAPFPLHPTAHLDVLSAAAVLHKYALAFGQRERLGTALRRGGLQHARPPTAQLAQDVQEAAEQLGLAAGACRRRVAQPAGIDGSRGGQLPGRALVLAGKCGQAGRRARQHLHKWVAVDELVDVGLWEERSREGGEGA